MQKLNDHQDDDFVNLNDGKVTNDMNRILNINYIDIIILRFQLLHQNI